MEWSPQQETVLRDCAAWLRRPYDPEEQIYLIFGYAGTGKTTIAKHLADDMDLQVQFAAYTGKAAYVMRSKGCDNCRTIHSLIYKPAGESKSDDLRRIEAKLNDFWAEPPEDDGDREARRQQQKALERQRDELLIRDKPKPMFVLNYESDVDECDVLVIDECSMVDETMGQDLMSFGKKIIVLGDPMQLPPVGSGGYFTKRTPNHLLTEIHRHAKESGILRLATDVRLTGTFSRVPGYYGDDCVVARKDQLEDLQSRVMHADQIIVGMNRTRHASNARYRELASLGPGPYPGPGDKIVCLRNEAKKGLLNGSLWRVHESLVDVDTETVAMTISSEEDAGSGVSVASWTHHFLGQEDRLKLKQWDRKDFSEFDFGFALTCHKSQGSQWNDVVLFNESGCFRNDAQRWLYTGITRAAKKLTLVL